MKLRDLQIGSCYTRGDDAEYLVMWVEENWAAVLHYSYNHKNATLEFWDQKELNEDYNQTLYEEKDYPLTEYLDEFEKSNYWDDMIVQI